jgi:CRP-like cAMP-binding protein
MISDEPVNLSAVALEDMQVCFIPKSEVMGYFDKKQSVFDECDEKYLWRSKEADDHMVNLAQKTVKERLAETLLYLNNTFGKTKIILCTTFKRRISQYNGTTESCIRLLSDFKN